MKTTTIIVAAAILGTIIVLLLLRSRRHSVDYPVANVRDDDPEMIAAIEQARNTLPSFLAAFKSPKDSQDHFLLKGRFREGDEIEHIWVADLTLDGTVFRGVLANEPQSLQGFTFKQNVEIAPEDVSDWMYIEDGKLVGGFTTRLLRRRMSPSEREEFELQLPYTIEP